MVTPDSGQSNASRQTLITGEAARRAALALKEELRHHALEELEGREFNGEYDCVTDPMTSDKPNRVSHIAYSYATQVVILDGKGKVQKVVSACDVGRAINPNSVEGQFEGGVSMQMGFALTEEFKMLRWCASGYTRHARPGSCRANAGGRVPHHRKKPVRTSLRSQGSGRDFPGVPTVPAIACAYWQRDGKLRTSLPLEETPYSRKRDNKGASESDERTCEVVGN